MSQKIMNYISNTVTGKSANSRSSNAKQCRWNSNSSTTSCDSDSTKNRSCASGNASGSCTDKRFNIKLTATQTNQMRAHANCAKFDGKCNEHCARHNFSTTNYARIPFTKNLN